MFVAKKFCVTTGVGVDKYGIASFDKALVMAGLGDFNLVRVSSIIPPNAKQVWNIGYPKGSVLFTAYSQNSTDQNYHIASAIAVAIPRDRSCVGVIMEYSCAGTKGEAIEIAEKLAVDALQRRNICEYDLVVDGVDAQGKCGLITTTFAAIVLL